MHMLLLVYVTVLVRMCVVDYISYKLSYKAIINTHNYSYC